MVNGSTGSIGELYTHAIVKDTKGSTSLRDRSFEKLICVENKGDKL